MTVGRAVKCPLFGSNERCYVTAKPVQTLRRVGVPAPYVGKDPEHGRMSEATILLRPMKEKSAELYLKYPGGKSGPTGGYSSDWRAFVGDVRDWCGEPIDNSVDPIVGTTKPYHRLFFPDTNGGLTYLELANLYYWKMRKDKALAQKRKVIHIDLNADTDIDEQPNDKQDNKTQDKTQDKDDGEESDAFDDPDLIPTKSTSVGELEKTNDLQLATVPTQSIEIRSPRIEDEEVQIVARNDFLKSFKTQNNFDVHQVFKQTCEGMIQRASEAQVGLASSKRKLDKLKSDKAEKEALLIDTEKQVEAHYEQALEYEKRANSHRNIAEKLRGTAKRLRIDLQDYKNKVQDITDEETKYLSEIQYISDFTGILMNGHATFTTSLVCKERLS